MSQTDKFTDEALDAKMLGDGGDGVEVEQEVPAAGPAPDLTEGIETTPEQAEEAAQAATEPEATELLAGKYKSVEDLAKSYDELQRMMGRKEAEHRAQMEQANAAFEQFLQQQNQSQFSAEPETFEDLEQLALTDPQRAFSFASQHGSADDLVPYVIAKIRSYDESTADSMFAKHLRDTVRREVDTVRQEIAPIHTANAVQTAFNSFVQRYPDYSEIEPELVREVASRQHMLGPDPNPQAMMQLLDDSYWKVQGQRYVRSLNNGTPAQPAPTPPEVQIPFSESGTPNSGPSDPDELTPEDEIKQAIFKANKTRSPWVN